jgi:hypothetical protein
MTGSARLRTMLRIAGRTMRPLDGGLILRDACSNALVRRDEVNLLGLRWSDYQARKEWLGDLGDRRLPLVRNDDGDKFVLAAPAVPKILEFVRFDAFMPFEVNQLGTTLRALFRMWY